MKAAEALETGRTFELPREQPNPNNERGKAVINRYREMNVRFNELGSAISPDFVYVDINLGDIDHPDLGKGQVIAHLRRAGKMATNKEGAQDIGYAVDLKLQVDDGTYVLVPEVEDFSNSGSAEKYNRMNLSDGAQPNRYREEWTPAQVHLAEENLAILEPRAQDTFNMLLDAALDENLNPHIASFVKMHELEPWQAVGQ